MWSSHSLAAVQPGDQFGTGGDTEGDFHTIHLFVVVFVNFVRLRIRRPNVYLAGHHLKWPLNEGASIVCVDCLFWPVRRRRNRHLMHASSAVSFANSFHESTSVYAIWQDNSHNYVLSILAHHLINTCGGLELAPHKVEISHE